MIEGTCKDCGGGVLINTLASGSQGNRYVPSHSWCTCPDRDTNPGKLIKGLVQYHANKEYAK